MAFFGLFKSKKDREIEGIFERLNERMNPLGEQDIRYDCARVGAAIHGKLAGDELRRFVATCKALVAISRTYDDDDFVRSIAARSGNAITAAEALDVYVYFAGEATHRSLVFGQIKANGHAITAEDWADIEDFARLWQQGTTSDAIPGAYGEFGWAPTNPIPTICIAGSEKYLSRLRYGGHQVDAKRGGSTQSAVTAGHIDMYHLDVAGRDLATLYICPYHRKNSKLAPRGFTLA